MVARELSAPARRTERRWLPTGLGVAWLYAYAGVWAITLAVGAAVSTVGLRPSVRHWLGLALKPDAAPQLGGVLALAAHNIPIASWPLLLGVLGAHRNRHARRVTDGFLLVWLIANTLPVGAALGAYGAPLLPYLPQLPVEWGGLALGASAWLVQRRRALTVAEGLGLLALIAGILLCSAALETVAVPHR
jgi:hypothetical protein